MTDSYQQFYSAYKDRLYSYLLYKSEDAAIAEDIMQESFTRHFKHYGGQAAASPALLFTIARNALADHHRSETRRHRTMLPGQKSVVGQEESYIAREASAGIIDAVNRLPEQDREILALAVGGMPYKEIARLLDLSLASVKVRIHRSRKKLQQMLEVEG
jgi:RNA polymerase sigma-70 factor (ECF subfamily)